MAMASSATSASRVRAAAARAPSTRTARGRATARATRGVAVRATTPSTPIESCDVAVVGAGPGGLATAIALQRAGVDVVVFEQRERIRPAGVAVFIWPHGLRNLRAICAETTTEVINAGATIDAIAIEQLTPTTSASETLVRIDVAGWSERVNLPPQIGITWARLTNALRGGLRDGTVRLGHALEGMTMTTDADGEEGDVVLTFAPPRSGGDAPPPVRVRGCVVGADGRNSKVRELTFGGGASEERDAASATSSPATTSAPEANVYYALSPNPPPGAGGAGAFNELRFVLCDGSGISLLDVGRGNLDLAEDGSAGDAAADAAPPAGQLMFGTTRFSERARAFETPEQRLAHLETLFRGTTPLLERAVSSTAPGAVVQTTLFDRPAAAKWSRGRVTLLGDASHCMYPSLGLGISTAFGDAVELSRCLLGGGGDGGGDALCEMTFADVERRLQARSDSHWSPYDRVRVVNAVSY